jgi:hypothetical protein
MTFNAPIFHENHKCPQSLRVDLLYGILSEYYSVQKETELFKERANQHRERAAAIEHT